MKTEMKIFASLPLYIITTLFGFGCVSGLPKVFRADHPRILPSVPEQDLGILPNETEQDPGIRENLEDSPGHSCPNGWTLFNSYCYLLVTDTLSWNQALWHCQNLGGQLVKINGAEENDFVLDLSKQKTSVKKVWIGLEWYTGDNYYWYDYSAPDYTNWAPGQPNGGAKEPCGSMYTEPKRENFPIAAAGYWNDIPCNGDQTIGTVCERLP